MAQLKHQTVRLSSGRHKSPEDGACVMELASMLAGESFTDHPTSVCPVIGALLRRYNDTTDEQRRQDLYEYAAKVVDSRGSNEVQRARVIHLERWTFALERRRRRWPWLRERQSRGTSVREVELVASRAAREIARHRGAAHEDVLGLIEELVAIGTPTAGPASAPGSRDVLGPADPAAMATP